MMFDYWRGRIARAVAWCLPWRVVYWAVIRAAAPHDYPPDMTVVQLLASIPCPK